MRTAETQAGRQMTRQITVTQAVFFPSYVKAETFIKCYCLTDGPSVMPTGALCCG